MTAGTTMIALRRLHRHFGTVRAVDDVSFEVRAGRVFGYIGPNGAGKTTSMRILATLDLPTYGDAYVAGFSVINDPDQVRRRLGYMPDSYGAYPNINCREYLDFFARAYGLVGRQRMRAVARVMDFAGLRPLADKPMAGLSKGMKQRLCLGRALIHDPQVLVLDEPAAGLDPRARIELRDMIRQLAAEGKTILISSHILTELAEMCDEVGILEKGKLLAVGSVADIQRRCALRDESGKTTIRVRLLGDCRELENWLTSWGDCQVLARTGATLSLSCSAAEEDQARLLRDLVTAGFSVVEFSPRTTSLEEVFMRVTKGEVQ